MTTNMYKNSTSPNPELNTILANLCLGDTQHDFGYKNEKLNMIKKYYDSGLPSPFSGIQDEDLCLTSVIEEYTNPDDTSQTPIKNDYKSKDYYLPMKISNPNTISNVSNKHNIKTINQYSYNVSYTDVKPGKQIITSQVFFDNLNIESTDIAVVIDAASIAFLEIIKNGTVKVNEKTPNVYYIYGPEVINDPATKTQIDAKIFGEEEGVNLIPCIPTNPTDFVYSYDFSESQDPNTLYLSQYFTKYNFNLSEIQKNKLGKTEKMTTNLTVHYGNYYHSIIDSKSKNDITFLSSILTNVINLLTNSGSFINKIFKKMVGNSEDKGKDLQKNQFDMNCGFQQKRSGDWLQVLLCSAIKDKSRGFRDIRDPAGNNVTKNIEKVFLVTHDRIALAFALLNGIDVIFANHHSKSHLHSAIVYQLNDPQQELQNKQELAGNYKKNAGKLKEEIDLLNKKIDGYQRDYYEVYIDNNVNLLNNSLDSYANRNLENDTKVNFNVIMNDLFPRSLLVVLYKQLLPELRGFKAKLTVFLDRLLKIESLNEETDYQEMITLYNEINTSIQDTNKLIDTTISKFNNENTKILKNFKKTIPYVNALSWKWDNNTGRRQWEILTNVLDGKNYKNDRNIFLYNLNSLPIILKQKIAYLYFKFYNIIQSISSEPSDISTLKFKAISLSFCVEVLLTMGGDGGPPTTITSQQIVDTMDTFISGKKTNPFEDLITDGVIVEENNDFNKELNESTYIGTDIGNEVTNDLNIDQKLIENPENGQVTSEKTQPITNELNNEKKVNMELNTKQATYPLLTMVLLNNFWYKNVRDTNKEFLKREFEINIGEEMEINPVEGNIINVAQRPLEELQQSVEPESLPIPGNIPTRSIFRGGDGEQPKIENLKQSVDLLSSVSTNRTNIFEVDVNKDVFKDTSICFHPLLPIYMITDVYYTTICNQDITESWDFDLFYNYFDFLKSLKEQVIQSYSTNTTLDKLTAYVIGLGLKELLFTSNTDMQGGYQKCMEVLNVTPDLYSQVSSFTEALVGRISGKINQSQVERDFGLKVLETNIVIDFGRSISTVDLFTRVNDMNVFNMEPFKQEVFRFSQEVADKIITDRGLKSGPFFSPNVSSTSMKTTSSSSNSDKKREYDQPEYISNKRSNIFGMNNPFQQQVSVFGGKGKKSTRKYKNKKRRYTRRIRKKGKKTKKNKRRKYKTRRN